MVQAEPAIKFIKPLMPAGQKTSLEFFNIFNFSFSIARRAVGGRADGSPPAS